MMLTSSGSALGTTLTFSDENSFKAAYSGDLTKESFETIAWDSWIYHTRLPSPIPALDLDDDPTDPDDGPDYDLDGHFTITGNSLGGPATEQFIIYRDTDAYPPHVVDGYQYLSFGPWYNILWPKEFDADNQHPIITIDNFDNSGASINAFGLYFYNYTPGTPWIVMELGDEYIPVSFGGTTTGDYFFGAITDTWFSHVRLHTNQNGGAIRIDEIYYTKGAVIPEPGSMVLTALGLSGLALHGRRRKR
jgi:hypothetical protein